MTSQRLKGRTAAVTGAAGGIGKNIAFCLAKEGADLVLSDIMEDEIWQTAEEIAHDTGSAVYVHSGDLSKEAAAVEMIEVAVNKTGRIDILVNNAGGGIILPFLDHTPETLVETVNRNLWTTIWCCRTALPHFVKQEFGRIINIGADSVRNGLFNHAGYNAAKGGVHGLTTGLAREFAPYRITVNTVAPCGCETEKLKAKIDSAKTEEQIDYIRKITEVIPMGRLAQMEEVSSVVAFLATEDASFVTGQVISVNGGSTML